MAVCFTDDQLAIMRRSLLDWYQTQGRTLPWRNEPDIYRVWISEIMLQQTQVKTVIPYYERWLAKFPTVESLAIADLQEVLKLWEGLGYYARARNLHHAAQQVVNEFQGEFPEDLDSILRLKGVGRTTAGGILSSARNLPLSILDGNVKRVLARLIALDLPPVSAINQLWEISDRLLDPDNPRDFNQALMDLGATLCTAKQPDCARCPWQKFCLAYLQDEPTNFPHKAIKKKVPTKKITAVIALTPQHQVFIQQRPAEGLLGGLWEFPNVEGDIAPIIQNLFPNATYKKSLETIFHAYTHFKIEVEPKVYYIESSGKETGWVKVRDLKNHPFSKANLKIIDQLFDPQLNIFI
jgi:A/G-specific adenine glycosylase